MQCQAKAKSTGKQCRRNAMKGKRVCSVHGGKTPGGIASPHFKTGRYSRYLPDRLIYRYQEAATDPELLALREDIALLDARVEDILKRVDTGESGQAWQKAHKIYLDLREAVVSKDQIEAAANMRLLGGILEDGLSDYAAWNEIGNLLEQRRRLVESERKRLVDMQQMVTAERLTVLLVAVVDVIRNHVTDRKTLSAISTDIGQLVTANAVRPADADRVKRP